MKRLNFATRIIVGAASALLLVIAASTASAQAPATSTSSLGCLPPNFVGENLYSAYESGGSVPGNLNLCRSYCNNIYLLCKHNVGSQNQCVRRLIRNLAISERTWCKDLSDPNDVRDCTSDVRDDSSFLWDVNRDATFDGQMYCSDLRISCNDDCSDS